MPLPRVLWFEGVSRGLECAHAERHKLPWARVAFRNPRKGEHYVSGAIPTAYRAPNDLGSPFLIVVPLTSPPRLRIVS